MVKTQIQSKFTFFNFIFLTALLLGFNAQAQEEVLSVDPVQLEENRLILLEGEGPIDFKGIDTPNDRGGSLDLSWTINDEPLKEEIQNILVFRKNLDESEYEKVKELNSSSVEFSDKNNLKDYTPYLYYLEFQGAEGKTLYKSKDFGPFMSKPQWFNTKTTPNLIFSLLTIIIILVFIKIARLGKQLYIRPLPGVKAIEDAVGRATEMGKPIIYSPGIAAIEDISTLASISILSKVAETVAEYGTRMVIPNFNPVVYTVTDEVCKSAFQKTGHPDAYRPEDIYFLTDRQFAYAAGIAGIMAREKPAANFFLGYFMAESLILSESGSMTGAIQIAGTDSISQIPFFIVSCDYTLIGEELYAAGAFMGSDVRLLGGLKGQDYVKLVIMILLIVGFLAHLFGVSGVDKFFTGG